MDAREYDILYKVEDLHWWYRGLHRLLGSQWRRHVGVKTPAVLDVGCGTGGVLQQLHHAGSAVGLDLSARALHYCRRRGLNALVRGAAQALPFPEAHFDVAVMLDVLYHRQVPDRGVPLSECLRVLKPGGVLFVNVPAYPWLRSSHDVGIHTGHRFTRGEVKRLLRGAGFEVRFLSYWNGLLLPGIIPVRLARKFSRRPVSDLETTGGGRLDGLLEGVLRLERGWLRFARLPFGLSIFAVARKP